MEVKKDSASHKLRKKLGPLEFSEQKKSEKKLTYDEFVKLAKEVEKTLKTDVSDSGQRVYF